MGRPVPLADRGPGRGVAGLAIDEGERPDRPDGALPGRLPGRHRRRPIRRARSARDATTTPTRSPPRSTRSRRSAAGSAPRRASRPVGAASSTSRSRSGPSSASPPSTARCPPVDRPAVQRHGEGRRSSAAARPACRRRTTSPGSAIRSRSSRRCPCPGGMMAIGIPSYRLPRDVLQAEIARIVGLGVDLRLEHGDGSRFHARRPRAAGLSRGLPGDRRVEEPPPRRPGRRRSPASSRRRSSSSRSTSARSRDSAARPSSSAAGAPRWTRRGRPGGAARRR